MYNLYVDGSCRGNGKENSNGGFGVIVIDVDPITHKETLVDAYSKQCENTTNNREELKAILWAMLQYSRKRDESWGNCPIVYSDSAYCVNTFNEWMFSWARNGWIKSDKKIPENLDLIQPFYNHKMKSYEIELRKVKGHAGHRWNELADQLATGAISAEEVMKGRIENGNYTRTFYERD